MSVDLYQSTAVSVQLNDLMKTELSGMRMSKSKVNAAIRYFESLPVDSYREEVKPMSFVGPFLTFTIVKLLRT